MEEKFICRKYLPRDQICEFDKKIEVSIAERNFTVRARIKEEYNITTSYYIELYSVSNALKELSQLRPDPLAKDFLENLMVKARTKLIEAAREKRDKDKEQIRKRAMELIDELTISNDEVK